jgi:hypothetical protein
MFDCLCCGARLMSDSEFCSDRCYNEYQEILKEEAEHAHYNPIEDTDYDETGTMGDHDRYDPTDIYDPVEDETPSDWEYEAEHAEYPE